MLQELEQQCQFVQWIDDEWPSRVGESFKALWKEMKYARRAVDRAHDALEDAMLYTEQMLNARQTMEEEVPGAVFTLWRQQMVNLHHLVWMENEMENEMATPKNVKMPGAVFTLWRQTGTSGTTALGLLVASQQTQARWPYAARGSSGTS